MKYTGKKKKRERERRKEEEKGEREGGRKAKWLLPQADMCLECHLFWVLFCLLKYMDTIFYLAWLF